MTNYRITWFINRTKHIDNVMADSTNEAIDILKSVYGEGLVVMMIEHYDFIYC